MRIIELASPAAAHAASALFAAVWGLEPRASPMSPEILRALALSGNYVVGAYERGLLVGASAGWLAGEPAGTLHSHITGVLSEYAGRDVGFALKQHQRAWARDRGLAAITWTFDPLVRRNAYFNIAKLGARAVAYLEDFYGPMDDAINRGLATDRLLVRWEVNPTTGSLAPPSRAEPIVVLDEAPDGGPLVSGADPTAPSLSCRAPADIEGARLTDPRLASAWRLAMREALGGAVAAGYAIVGVSRDGRYRLELRPNVS